MWMVKTHTCLVLYVPCVGDVQYRRLPHFTAGTSRTIQYSTEVHTYHEHINTCRKGERKKTEREKPCRPPPDRPTDLQRLTTRVVVIMGMGMGLPPFHFACKLMPVNRHGWVCGGEEAAAAAAIFVHTYIPHSTYYSSKVRWFLVLVQVRA